MNDEHDASARRGFFITDRTHTPAGTVSLALLGGGLLGIAAWWLQGILPTPWGTLANTSALWGLAGFAAAFLQHARGVLAVTAGAAALLGMTVMFALLDGATGPQWIAYTAVGLLAGAAFGLAGSLARSERTRDRLICAAIAGGVIAGEGLYGVTVVAASGPQWWAELALGLVIATISGRGVRERIAAVGIAALVALALLRTFSLYDAVLAA
jgi:hypothetical protein